MKRKTTKQIINTLLSNEIIRLNKFLDKKRKSLDNAKIYTQAFYKLEDDENELLALGNIVSANNQIYKVDTTHEYGVTLKNKEGGPYVKYEKVSGVPITEEWLEKLGAVSNNCRDGSWEWGNFRLYWTSQGVTVDRYGNHLEVVEYVHQLQNIHHFFDGKIEVDSNGME